MNRVRALRRTLAPGRGDPKDVLVAPPWRLYRHKYTDRDGDPQARSSGYYQRALRLTLNDSRYKSLHQSNPVVRAFGSHAQSFSSSGPVPAVGAGHRDVRDWRLGLVHVGLPADDDAGARRRCNQHGESPSSGPAGSSTPDDSTNNPLTALFAAGEGWPTASPLSSVPPETASTGGSATASPGSPIYWAMKFDSLDVQHVPKHQGSRKPVHQLPHGSQGSQVRVPRLQGFTGSPVRHRRCPPTMNLEPRNPWNLGERENPVLARADRLRSASRSAMPDTACAEWPGRWPLGRRRGTGSPRWCPARCGCCLAKAIRVSAMLQRLADEGSRPVGVVRAVDGTKTSMRAGTEELRARPAENCSCVLCVFVLFCR